MLPRRSSRTVLAVLAAAAVVSGCGAADPAPRAEVAPPSAAATPEASATVGRVERSGPSRPVPSGAGSAGALLPAPAPRTTPPATTAPSRSASGTAAPPAGPASAQVGEARLYAIDCGRPEAEIAATGAPRVRRGRTTIYAGGWQVSGDNQDPRVIRFDGGRQTWCRTDLERSGDDGRAYGLLWSGDTLVAVFSAVGTQGEPAGDLRRFTGAGWLTSYSDGSPKGGGGAKAAAVVRLDPATGAGVRGTWITADNNGKVNSVAVTGLAPAGAGTRVTVSAYYLPRGADRRPLACTGSSPFPTTYTFAPSFGTVTALTPDPRCR